MTIHRSTLVVAAVLSAVPLSAVAQIGYGEAIVACEQASAEMANLVAELRNEQMARQRAEKIQEAVMKLSQKVTDTSISLDAEIKRVKANPDRNKEELAKLEAARAKLKETKSYVKTLVKHSNNVDSMIGAYKSGLLQRTTEKVNEATKGMGEAIKSSHESLALPVGSVDFKEVKITEGKLKLFVLSGGEQTEVVAGQSIPVRALPIRIRAVVMDEQKTRLSEQKEKGLLPAGTEFVEVDDNGRGHKFQYSNPNVGTTTWQSTEEYSFVPQDEATKKKIRGLKQTGSDACCKGDKGDVLELHTEVPAQNLVFQVEGTVVKWQRVSKMKAGERKEDVVPKDNVARAWVTLSVYP
jgi:hypothetical protein